MARAVPYFSAGTSPHDVAFASNYDKKLNKNWVTPRFSSLVYKIPVHLQARLISNWIDM